MAQCHSWRCYNVVPTLHRWTNPHWPNVICWRCTNISYDVGPTSVQHFSASWDCIEVWGNTFPTYITPLNRLQNRAIRIILGCNKGAHLQPLYTSLKMLDISKICMYNVQMFMFKRYHCLLPDIFNSFFCKNVDIIGRETRQSENLRIPEGVIGIRRRTIRFSGVSLNNFFHNKISYKYSINSYKFQLKEYLLSGSSLPLIPK